MRPVSFNTKGGSQTIRIGKQDYHVGGKLPFQGDLAEFYDVSFDLEPTTDGHHGGTRFDRMLEDLEGDEGAIKGVLKITLDPLDNDLAENEANILKHIFPSKAKDEKFYRYFARPFADFTVLADGVERRALITPFLEGYVSMAEVAQAFPKGLDFRDVVWMYKRLLSGLGFAHLQEVVHGAILPPHVMVHPTGHGAKIIDWSYAVHKTGHVRAMSKVYEVFYAPEILDRKSPTAATDIYMAAKCFIHLLGGDVRTNKVPDAVPKEIQDFLAQSLVPLPNMRPQDAWEVHEKFDQLLLSLVGKPTYRRLNMPARTP